MPKRPVQDVRGGMADHTARAAEDPEMDYFPANQIEGDAWVIGVLQDLIAFAEHRELKDVREALEEAHRIAARMLLH